MYAASPHGAARLPPDEHLRSACRWGKRSKTKAKAKADQKIAAFGSSYIGLFHFKRLAGCKAAIAGKPAPTGIEFKLSYSYRFGFSPLKTMSASSSTAFDLDPRATSEG
jgi:hypothetical protein